jgi:uncharacterized protein YkwD
MTPQTSRARRLALFAVAVATTIAAAVPGTAAASGCSGTNANPNHASAATIDSATLCLLNRARRQHHLRSLKRNSRLSLASERHARDMVRRGYFSHDSLGGSDFVSRIKRTSYLRSARNWQVGENIAWGSGEEASPRSIVSMWMHSPGHRANILNRRFKEIGLGVALGAPERGVEDAATYVNDFGARG